MATKIINPMKAGALNNQPIPVDPLSAFARRDRRRVEATAPTSAAGGGVSTAMKGSRAPGA